MNAVFGAAGSAEAHFIEQAVADQVASVQFGIVIPVGVFRGRPARPQRLRLPVLSLTAANDVGARRPLGRFTLLALIYGVIMTLPRRAQMTLGALSMVLLLGILGLAWWWWSHRPGYRPVTRFRRVRAALVAAGLVIIAVGTVARLTAATQSVSACSPTGAAQAAAHSDSSGISLRAQIVATWPETGIGLLYARAKEAHVCLSHSADYYVGVHSGNILGARAVTVGDIVLTPEFNLPGERLRALAGHEARHRVQWAVGTVIGGPLAFPVAYAIDDFFFPGARNHFERLAGLEAGGYSHEGTGPVLGPAQLATLGVLAAIIVVALLRVWHRRASTRLRSQR